VPAEDLSADERQPAAGRRASAERQPAAQLRSADESHPVAESQSAARRRPAAELRSTDECQPAAEDLARAFGFLGKRWTAIILGHLSHGPAGFRDLSRGIGGISDSVLSERLADLAAGGLITRTVRDGPPVTVTYQLTDRGHALIPALDLIARWAHDNLPPDKC
jgi:DNA-binding HxlR family transcriptional regulator